jgi:hypothetical protein
MDGVLVAAGLLWLPSLSLFVGFARGVGYWASYFSSGYPGLVLSPSYF